MKPIMILTLAAASFAFAQPEPRHLAVTAVGVWRRIHANRPWRHGARRTLFRHHRE